MERRQEFGEILYAEMLECLKEKKETRVIILEGSHDELGLATENELKEEVEFMVQTLNLHNYIWLPIRTTRDTILFDQEINTIEANIELLMSH